MNRRVLIGGNEAYKVEYWRVFKVVDKFPEGVSLTKTDVFYTVPDDYDYNYFHYEVGAEQHYICVPKTELVTFENIKIILNTLLKDTCFKLCSTELNAEEDFCFTIETKTPSCGSVLNTLTVFTDDENASSFEFFWKETQDVIEDYCNDFDINEFVRNKILFHAWGCPSIEQYLDDAKWIKEQFYKLLDKIKEMNRKML